jgi:hypothetical protein
MMCKADGSGICLPGSEIPNWFSHQADEGVSLCLSESGISSWFNHTMGRWFSRQTMASLSFRVPSFWDGKIGKSGKMLLCVVFAANNEDLSRVGNFNWRLSNKTRTHLTDYSIMSIAGRIFGSCEDHIFVQATGYRPVEMKSGDEIELSVEFYSMSMDRSEELKGEIQVKKCGIHLLVDDPNVTDTRGDKTTRFFVCKQKFPIYAGDEVRIVPRFDWANATEVDESGFYTDSIDDDA